jgi:demethylmenaquinone methyltransferase/2-methoxy-6-polyprenyl-1,4-benzoquinol methylase
MQAVALAEAVGAGGHVTGLDISDRMLEVARSLTRDVGLEKRISFRSGDVRRLPFDDGEFDWSWSVDCVGYAPIDPVPLVTELSRVVRPGGTVAIMAWSSETLLPGYPQLESRLRSTTAGLAPFANSSPPESHFLRALGWFDAAGLVRPSARTFVGSVHAPLSGDEREALVALFDMRWPGVKSELTREDCDQFERLCRPKSDTFVVDDPSYYAFFTYTMFAGRKAT